MGATIPQQLPLPLRLDDDATFDNFLVSAKNRQLLDYLSVEDPTAERFVWLYGEPGAGRTHLLQANCHRYAEQDLRCTFVPLSMHSDLLPEILLGLDTVDLVCLDDIEAVAGMLQWETALFNLYNQLMDSGTRLWVASRQAPVRLDWQLPDLASRLQAGLALQIAALNDEEKCRALQLRARARGFELPDDVATYLMLRSARDMSSLFAVLQRLDEVSLEKKRRITVPLLRDLLEKPR